jgi:hypothetical protein
MADKIAREVAEQEFDRFVEEMDLDLESGTDDEDKAEVDKHRGRLVRAIMGGSMVVNDSGELVYTVGEQVLTFREPTGADLQAQDAKKAGQDFGKLFAILASITGTSAKTFAAMKSRNLNVCTSVMTLMMG